MAATSLNAILLPYSPVHKSQVWLHKPWVPHLRRQRQADFRVQSQPTVQRVTQRPYSKKKNKQLISGPTSRHLRQVTKKYIFLTPVPVPNLLHPHAESWPQSYPKRRRDHLAMAHLRKLAVTKPLYPSHARHGLALGGGFPGNHHGRPPGEALDFSPYKVAYSKLLIILQEPTERISVTKAGEPWETPLT